MRAPERERRPWQRAAHLRLVASRDGADIMARPQMEQQPAGLTAWDIQFLRSLAGWPLPLLEGQRATLRWIARRARAAS